MNNRPNEKVLERIQKLLSLAGNNPSQEEAQSAMLMAQKLMAQHNIEMDMIPGTEEKKEVVEDNSIREGAKTQWKRQLARIICDNFRTSLLINPNTGGFCIVGNKEDVQITISVYNYAASVLDKGMTKLRRDYRKQGLDTTGISGDYAAGFLKGIKEKFEEQVQHEGWGLVLVKDDAVIERTKSLSGGHASRGVSLNRRGNSQIFNQGYEQGQSCAGYNKQLN